MNSRCLLCFAITMSVIITVAGMRYAKQSADGHRCGMCPTYLQRVCAFNRRTNSTFIFDNHCLMDLYNCVKGTHFCPMRSYEKCLFFGNFAYVYGYRDNEYPNYHIKNPDFVKK